LKPLVEWEKRLPNKYFARLRRSAMINLEYVEKIDEWFHQAYRVFLKGFSQPFVMSRRYAVRLKKGFS
jgi:DNA-binding LytR/AlgR family response regulator